MECDRRILLLYTNVPICPPVHGQDEPAHSAPGRIAWRGHDAAVHEIRLAFGSGHRRSVAR